MVIDPGHAQAGNILLDVGNKNLTGTDLMNTLGHEVLETQAYQGQDGLFFGPNDNATQEALGSVFGSQFADRITQAVSENGGNLNASYTRQSNLNLKNSQAVAKGTQAANQVGNAKVDYRQATKGEILLIDRIADAYAEQQKITPEEARRTLTQQALSMIDETWANQTHIEEDVVAKAYLIDAAKQDGEMHRDANGGMHLAFELAKPEDYQNSELNNSHVKEIEKNGVSDGIDHRVEKGWLTNYATEEGRSPWVENGVMGEATQQLRKDVNVLLHETKVIDLIADSLSGLYRSITELPKEGSEGNKIIAELQGDRVALVQHEKENIVDSVTMLAEVVGGVKLLKVLPDGGSGEPLSKVGGDSVRILDGDVTERSISTTRVGNVVPNSNGPDLVNLSDIKYTQATVSIKTGDGTPVLNIASEMKLNGWDLSKGTPDLIRLDDGFMTLDHRRLVAADWAGLDKIPGNIHGFDELLPTSFTQSGRFSSFESPVAFSDLSTRTSFYKGDLPETWGQAGMIRSLQQQERFGQFPITGSSELPSFTFKGANDWAKYINQLERLQSQ
ncbi:hypothetical protein [Alkalimarinus sediminis]|uniref:hypothetical protein n=1 Tax=Alkalimarinus sediminis TaxID=1632866 RepID=UPI0020431A73|nr:hypothetical protein [Alkalimarinus sediminis]